MLSGFNKNQNEEEVDIAEIIQKTSMAISAVIIPLIDSLGSIDIQEILALPEELT